MVHTQDHMLKCSFVNSCLFFVSAAGEDPPIITPPGKSLMSCVF